MSVAEPLSFESVDDLPRDVAWQEFAMCKGRLELFFAKKAERPQARERREARANMLCTACPVRIPCRQFARENHEYGYWAEKTKKTGTFSVTPLLPPLVSGLATHNSSRYTTGLVWPREQNGPALRRH